jgi:hypothetical protein
VERALVAVHLDPALLAVPDVEAVAVSLVTTPDSCSSTATMKSGAAGVKGVPSSSARSGSSVVAYARTSRTGPNIAVRIVSG